MELLPPIVTMALAVVVFYRMYRRPRCTFCKRIMKPWRDPDVRDANIRKALTKGALGALWLVDPKLPIHWDRQDEWRWETVFAAPDEGRVSCASQLIQVRARDGSGG